MGRGRLWGLRRGRSIGHGERRFLSRYKGEHDEAEDEKTNFKRSQYTTNRCKEYRGVKKQRREATSVL